MTESSTGDSSNNDNKRSGERRPSRPGANGGDRGSNYGDRQYNDGDRSAPERKASAMEVLVDHSIDKAMKVLKRKLIKEGLFKELKARRYYEKPSEKKKRKGKESAKKARKEEARNKKNSILM